MTETLAWLTLLATLAPEFFLWRRMRRLERLLEADKRAVDRHLKALDGEGN